MPAGVPVAGTPATTTSTSKKVSMGTLRHASTGPMNVGSEPSKWLPYGPELSVMSVSTAAKV